MSQQMNGVNGNSQIQIIDRVSNLPLVKSALGYANGQYGRIKGINPLVNATLTFNEQALTFLLSSAAYILEKQLPLADSLACQGLDRLEKRIPVIKQSPEEIYSSGVNIYNDIKGYGSNRVEVWKQFGYQKVQSAIDNQYAQAIIKTVDSAVDFTDNAFDQFYPPGEDEEDESITKQNINLMRKMSNLSDKMRRRISRNASIQVDNIHKQSQEALQHIRQSVNLIQYAKTLEEAARQKLNERLALIQQQARHIWEELNKEEEKIEGVKTFDQQILALARRTTKTAIESYNQLSQITNFPTNAINAFKLCSDYARNVNNQLNQVSNIKELTDLALQKISSSAVVLQNLLNKALAPVFPTLIWVTPKGENQHSETHKDEGEKNSISSQENHEQPSEQS